VDVPLAPQQATPQATHAPRSLDKAQVLAHSLARLVEARVVAAQAEALADVAQVVAADVDNDNKEF